MASINANRPHTPPPPPPTATTATVRAIRSKHTTRDQRLQIQTLHDAGLTYEQIRKHISDVSLHQIGYAVANRITPKKRSGRPTFLTQEEIAMIIEWVCASKQNRRAP
jgi:hypothetical protein